MPFARGIAGFGNVGPIDLRNSFRAISPSDTAGWYVREYDYTLHKEWGTVGEAADDLECSESKIYRRLADFEREWECDPYGARKGTNGASTCRCSEISGGSRLRRRKPVEWTRLSANLANETTAVLEAFSLVVALVSIPLFFASRVLAAPPTLCESIPNNWIVRRAPRQRWCWCQSSN